MKIHNLMEKLVIDAVEDFFLNKEFIEEAGCENNDACKTDVTCFVLNRITPRYTTSSRGLEHIGRSYIDKPQNIADITILIKEGVRQVGAHRRPPAVKTEIISPEPPIFNFPIIKGKVIDGKTFAPYSGSTISLLMDGKLVPMNGQRWPNPGQLIDATEGNFLFWPLPVKAEMVDEERSFSFLIEINADGYKPVKHFINFDLKAEQEFINSMEVNRIFKVDPIYLFNIDDPEEIVP